MKKWIAVIAIVVLIAAGGAYMFLKKGKAEPTAKTNAASEILPPIKASSEIQADAAVIPVRSASLSVPAGGIVSDIPVSEGQLVKAGQLLLKLSNSKQEASVAEAEAGVQRARARLAELKAGARVQELRAAEAARDAAKAALQKVMEGADKAQLIQARADLNSADLELQQAALQQVLDGEQINGQSALQRSKEVYESARQGTYDAKTAIVKLRVAINGYTSVKKRLAELEKGSSPATIASAKAELERAQAELDLKRAGERSETIALAQADLAAAQAVLRQSKAAFDDTELRAPFDGTVTSIGVKVGELVSAGVQLIRLGDLSRWQIETDNLTEMSVARIQKGDTVTVSFDALPKLKLPGKVAHIEDIGENKQGDITYTVTVDLEKQDPRLRWNMTASVVIKPKA